MKTDTAVEATSLSVNHANDIIGRRIMHECGNGRSFEALVVGYDATSQQHIVKYDEGHSDVRPDKQKNI
jgi:hypothetical protein